MLRVLVSIGAAINVVAATVTYEAATKAAVLDPSDNLQRGATYKAVVTSGAKELAGNAFGQNPSVTANQMKTWFFTICS